MCRALLARPDGEPHLKPTNATPSSCQKTLSETSHNAKAKPRGTRMRRTVFVEVERKIAHLVRVRWGGRNARTRGLQRVATDIDARAAVVNLARLSTLGVHWNGGSWATAPP
jgi:hypothetical protein